MRTGASAVRVAARFAIVNSQDDGSNDGGGGGTGGQQIVNRERTAATNRYRIVKPGAEPGTFEGFGSAVPLEVQEVTGVRPVKIADQEIMLNLSQQLDAPFLGQSSTTAPGRAKFLGKLAGTEELDVAGADVSRDMYRASRDVKALEDEIGGAGGLKEQITGFAWIEELGERIDAAELALEKVREAAARLSALKEKQSRLAAVDAGIVAALTVLDRWTLLLPKLETAAGDITADVERCTRLQGLESRLLDVRAGIDVAKQTLRRWSGVLNAEKAAGDAEGAASRCRTLRTLAGRLTDVAHGVEAAQGLIYGLRGLDDAESVAGGVSEKLDRAGRLHGLRIRLGQVTADVKLCRVNLERPRVKYAEKAARIVKTANDAAVRAGDLVILRGRLNEVAVSREQAGLELQQWQDRLPNIEQEYFDTLKGAGICPTCGSTNFDISKLREVV